MDQRTDAELLSAYVNEKSEPAFEALVERYIALVYSAALRQVHHPEMAREVTQAVFILLAQKARQLNGRTLLSGWLCRVAYYVARNALKGERRRQFREQEAYMQSLVNQSEAEAWQQFAPLLDEAVAQLNETDRNAIVLRFYQQKPLDEVGGLLGIDPDAAQKRVSRALEKLRKLFAQRGVNSTTAIIAETISGNSIQAVPVGLAKTISASALAKGATASASTLTLVKGALKVMAWTKIKTAVVVGISVLIITACITPHVWYYHLGPNAWRHRFQAAYGLKNGEVIRYIPPPFIRDRLTYYQKECDPNTIPTAPSYLFLWQDDEGKFTPLSYGHGPKRYPLSLLLHAFGLKKYEVEGSDNLLNTAVTGDWTVYLDAQSSAPDARLAALGPILWKVTKHHILIEKRIVERDVVVVTGNHCTAQSGTPIQLYDQNVHPHYSEFSGDLTYFFDEAGERFDMRFVDETTIDMQTKGSQVLAWAYHRDLNGTKNHQTELADNLKNLAGQTGLVFTREQRPEPVWFVTEQ